MNQKEKWYNLNQAAQILGVSKKTVRRYVKQGKVTEEGYTLIPGKYGQEIHLSEEALNKLNGVVYTQTEEVYSGNEDGLGMGGETRGIPQEDDRQGFDDVGIPKVGQQTKITENKDIFKEMFFRYENALVRLGQLESQKIMLTERAETLQKIEEEYKNKLEKAEEEGRRFQQELEKERAEKNIIQKELLLNSMPWWKKFFHTKEKLEEEIQKKLK
jgi:hypothetical protein